MTRILEAIASKDKTELRSAKVAAVMSCAIMRKFLLPKLEGIVDDEQKISHTKVAEDLEELFDDPDEPEVKPASEPAIFCA